eukprot:358988-Chlamydomonas_euryale.AAC.4
MEEQLGDEWEWRKKRARSEGQAVREEYGTSKNSIDLVLPTEGDAGFVGARMELVWGCERDV